MNLKIFWGILAGFSCVFLIECAAYSASISGHIFQADGVTPITGDHDINVEIYDHEYPDNYIKTVPVDPHNGQFYMDDIEPGMYDLRVHADNYIDEFWATPNSVFYRNEALPLIVNKGDRIKNIDFQLDRGILISGTVYQSDGIYPIGNIGVTVTEGQCDKMWDFTTTSNPDGTYSIRVPEGTFYVSAGGGSNYITELWASPESVRSCENAMPIEVSEGKPASGIDFQLELGARIFGTVFQGDGFIPVSGDNRLINIFAFRQNPCVAQGASFGGPFVKPNGTYSILVEPGTYYIFASAKNFVDKWWSHSGSVTSCTDAEPVTLGPGESLINMDFHLDEGAVISGILYEKDGKTPYVHYPMTTVEVTSEDPCTYTDDYSLEGTFTTFVDPATGSYSIHVPSGTYSLIANVGSHEENKWWASSGSVSTSECDKAEAVTVAEGNSYPGMDFQMNVLRGDVSDDGDLNIVDALFIARCAVGLSDTCEDDTGDVNCDGDVNILDALFVARKAVGLPVNGWCGVGDTLP